ncbi:TetR/AcrR family transcriptional regulator [Brucepastera parasyntrophica]|uniref:TetR/AcrR family transcriptional regulator n=1 Tax=Brucepastera parasyntrophica TaxID=2880008 RepID=UPI002108D843|nr:TetR/AcrR family transcriptional regulator [Brucepastera parasyntrophica]ULQ61074.1 TetR/AcrR family transcriptional regulator [Brucepastera parasyntrophica]
MANTRQKNPAKKKLILQSAKKLFSEKGYDATGMEEIASGAGVPKSLIYYHFKSKEELLDTITSIFFDEYDRILRDASDRGIEKISRYISFLKTEKECIRIILAESLKNTGNNTLFFKVMKPLIDYDNELSGTPEPGTGRENQAHWVTEFFTSIVPTVLFVCYEDNWCSYFGVRKKDLEKDFARAYKLTHGAYHRHIEKESL